MTTLRAQIVNIVVEAQGLKWTDLVVKATKVLVETNPQDFRHINVNDVITSLIEDGELIEIEYVLPALSYRVKSFILPAGTIVEVKR